MDAILDGFNSKFMNYQRYLIFQSIKFKEKTNFKPLNSEKVTATYWNR